MKRISFILLLLGLIVVSGSLSAATIPLFKSSSKQVLPQGSSSYRLTVDRQYVAEVRASQSFSLPVPVEAFGADERISDPTLDLTAFSVIGNGTHVIIQTSGGDVAGLLPTVKTFRGSLRGVPNSLAVLSVYADGRVSGFVRTAKNTYTLGSTTTAAYLTKTDNIPYSADLSQCAMTNEALYDRGHRSAGVKSKNVPLAATQTMKVAVDVDKACNDYFGGSQSEITNWITARFAVMSAIYESEIDVALELGRIYIYTANDPYSAANINTLLDKFTNHWAANNKSVDRTIAHLFSKQDLGNPGGASGLAWLGVLCNKDIGYGVSRIMGSEQFPSADELVTAHEIGHNVGSRHTHNCDQYVPPIDSCYPAEGGCFGGTKQIKGTIMSYCNQRNFNFHPRTIAVMKEAVAEAPCLGTLAQIQVKTDSLIFPPIGLNTSKDTTLTALIKNTGEVPLTITSISIDNVEIDSEFYLKSLPTFPKVLAPNATQNVTVTFRPAYGGERFGELKITHNASGAMSVIGLRGVGAEPDPDFLVLDLDFGEITHVGNYDSALVYVENLGTSPLIISKTEITGTSASDFSIVSGAAPPNISVPPNQTATIKVRFTAKSIGPKNATLFITHNGYEPPDNVDYIDLYADVVSLLSVKAGKPAVTASLSVTPNPSRDQMTIEVKSDARNLPCALSLVDLLGRTVALIANEKLAGNGLQKTWDIDPSIADGTYLLVAKIGESSISHRVVIVK